jgi:hypothetical protein
LAPFLLVFLYLALFLRAFFYSVRFLRAFFFKLVEKTDQLTTICSQQKKPLMTGAYEVGVPMRGQSKCLFNFAVVRNFFLLYIHTGTIFAGILYLQ